MSKNEGHDVNQSGKADEAYEDRNLAVMALLKQLKLNGYTVGYREDDNETDEWVVVYAHVSKIFKDAKQVSWHVPRSLVEDTPWISKQGVEWDGHSREEKNNRLRDFAGLDPK